MKFDRGKMSLKKLCVFFVGCLLVFSAVCELGLCREGGLIRMRPGLGGVRDFNGNQNSLEMETLARFAVEEHNKKENSLLEFARVLKSKEQVVAGKVYYLTLEAIDAGKKKIYEAKVWVKPWMNFKKLEDFKYSKDAPSFTSSDLGAKRGGWRVVPTQDPEVKAAAKLAVKTLQERSNSLYPYVLIKILLAEAEVIENKVRFQLLLKLRRGTKEEQFKVIVNKSVEVFLNKKMDPGHF